MAGDDVSGHYQVLEELGRKCLLSDCLKEL